MTKYTDYPVSARLQDLIDRDVVGSDVYGITIVDLSAGRGSVFTYSCAVQCIDMMGDERGQPFPTHEAALEAAQSDGDFREFEGSWEDDED